MNNNAQTSVELLLVALVVLAGSIAIASYYTSINSSVTATELLKVKVLEKTGGLGYFAYIEKIEQNTSGSTINFSLSAEPDTLTCDELGLTESVEGSIKDTITKKTAFKTINFSLNGTTC